MFISGSVAETEAAGARIASNLHRGDVLAVIGGLGAGKTHFVKGIARGLGCSEEVTSPTFTVLHEYRGGILPIYHFDFYRLESFAALRDIGFEEYLYGDGVCVLEWADRLPDAIPQQAYWIRLEIPSMEKRSIDLSAFE